MLKALVVVFFFFFLIGLVTLVVAAAAADAPPYVPRSNEKLIADLNALCAGATAPVVCVLHPVWDTSPYLSELPVLTTVAAIQKGGDSAAHQNEASMRTVMVVCGMTARGFVSSEVCAQFIRELCADRVPDMEHTRYVIVPFANERGRDFVQRLWTTYRHTESGGGGGGGQPAKSLLQQQLPASHSLTLEAVYSERLPTAPTYLACLDGTIRLALMQNNFPQGWAQRSQFVMFEQHRNEPEDERFTHDTISSNGKLPLSEPETRIVRDLLTRVAPETLIVVGVGHPLLAVPFDDPVLAATSLLDNAQVSHLNKALNRAKHTADGKLPAGYGAEVRRELELEQRGTLSDYAMTAGVSYVYNAQVYRTAAGAAATSAPTGDCLYYWVPSTQHEVDTLAAEWVARVKLLSKRM